MMKKYGTYLGIAVIVLLFAALALFRGDMVEYISDSRAAHMSADAKSALSEQLTARFDYRANGQSYTCTFLEFGSTGCSACRQMATVMESVRADYPNRVNVVFVNVTLPENQDMVNYFGIATIPTQVLLDRSGQEYYRHTGYIAAEDLAAHFR